MIEIIDKEACCGCSACAQICPKKSIEMKADYEGFLYPIVDTKDCINCHLCENVCPVLNIKKEHVKIQNGYIVQHKDSRILRESTSGGAFTAIAEWVIGKNGVVFGAAYDNQMVVKHTYVNKKEDLGKFRNSKYSQSEIGTTYQEAKAFLDKGIWVLYSGTPCQLEGLLRFLRKSYECLLTVDVVCRACPSPLVFKKYLDLQKQITGTDFDNLLFRDKYYGYQYSSMSIMNQKKYLYHEGIDTDSYLRAFFSGISIRPSCLKCVFRKRYRETDLTIWDCFDIAIYDKKMNDNRGATKVLAHTEKGRRVMTEINVLKKIQVCPDMILKMDGDDEINIVLQEHPLRSSFFEDLNKMDPQKLFEKYFPITMKNRIEKAVRILTIKLGLYSLVKNIYITLVGRDNIKR
ncbi:MAG: Coenzyme F420 hydrogenase/dehydrogenase, beta subunit C-terminal domain [Bacteroidaceae bacterium]|nr:Coenzyme F420 hydrogenase/dehydrogenase, beta subunit C-terminal domain [Bacteroidaceae bacterium]